MVHSLINKTLLLDLYSRSFLIREVEKRISSEYSNQEMRCPTHLSIGQEVVAATMGVLATNKDTFISTHRCHAHYIAKGGSLEKMLAEIYGKEEGCSLGRGGSMHLMDLKKNFMGSSAIVGNSIPIGVGLSFNQGVKSKHISFTFFGDGATEEGAFYESLNIASTFKLPTFFICENNLYSVYSSLEPRQPKNRNLHQLCKSLDIKSFRVNDYDISKFYKLSKELINYVRKYNRPALIEVNTYRFLEHCGPNNDDNLLYRSKKEVNFFKKKDALKALEKEVLYKFDKKVIDKLQLKIINDIDKTFKKVQKLKSPNIQIAFQGIYA